nr:hypothetical protein [Tanacetum cinerariifolium]
KYGLPIVTCIDNPRAFVDLKSEELRDNLAGRVIVVDFSLVTDFPEATCRRYEGNTWGNTRDQSLGCKSRNQMHSTDTESANCLATSFDIGERKNSSSHTISTTHDEA